MLKLLYISKKLQENLLCSCAKLKLSKLKHFYLLHKECKSFTSLWFIMRWKVSDSYSIHPVTHSCKSERLYTFAVHNTPRFWQVTSVPRAAGHENFPAITRHTCLSFSLNSMRRRNAAQNVYHTHHIQPAAEFISYQVQADDISCSSLIHWCSIIESHLYVSNQV